MVDSGVFSDGFVVSEAHANFAGKYCRRRNCIHVLPAGVDESFSNPFPNQPIWKPSFVYHGRLDKHVGACTPLLVQASIIWKGGNAHAYRWGDAVRGLQNIADNNGWFSIIETLKKRNLPTNLQITTLDCCPYQIPPFGDWQAHSKK